MKITLKIFIIQSFIKATSHFGLLQGSRNSVEGKLFDLRAKMAFLVHRNPRKSEAHTSTQKNTTDPHP